MVFPKTQKFGLQKFGKKICWLFLKIKSLAPPNKSPLSFHESLQLIPLSLLCKRKKKRLRMRILTKKILFELECLTWLIVKFDKYLFLIDVLFMICFFLLLYKQNTQYVKRIKKKCVFSKTQISNSDVPECTALLISRPLQTKMKLMKQWKLLISSNKNFRQKEISH